MNICLLKCGSVFKHLEHISGDYNDMFARLFSNNSFDIKWDVFEVYKGNYPVNLTRYDGFLSSGSLSGVYEDDPWIKEYQTFVQRLFLEKYKHVGICFGHQMIARALGGVVEKAAQGWGLGIKTVTIHEIQPWMSPVPGKTIKLIFSHQDQVIKLPVNAQVIASSAHCPVTIFTVDDLFLGIQPHPEFSKAYSKATIEYRRESVERKTVENALASLVQTTDEKLLAHWIYNFFTFKKS